MGTASETGHAINISNYKLLIDTCIGFGTACNPRNKAIFLAAMTGQQATAQTANATLSKAETEEKNKRLIT